MRAVLIALLLAAAPAALSAQYHPTPGDTARLPEVPPPSLFPQASSRGAETLAGAAEGAVLGAVAGAVRARRNCVPAGTGTGGVAADAVAGALWGGVRGLFGLRGRRGPVRTDMPDTGRDPAPPVPSVARTGCEALDPAPGLSR
jgi:hypothetical protein